MKITLVLVTIGVWHCVESDQLFLINDFGTFAGLEFATYGRGLVR